MQKSASIQPRTSLLKFDDLARTKVRYRILQHSFYKLRTQTGCKIQIFSFPFYTLSPEYQIIANFSELVLLCIEADFCTQIRIFQHFSRSTRFSHFCTAFICKIRFKHRSKFCKNCTFFVNFHYFCSKSTFFAPILMKISRNFKIHALIFDILEKRRIK